MSDPTTYANARNLLDRYPCIAAGTPDTCDHPVTPLTQAEFKVTSQNGENGILAEILCRIGSSTRTFVEFGAQTGVEGNCFFFADWCRWEGLLIEADGDSYSRLQRKYAFSDRVTTVHSMVTPRNINDLLSDMPTDLDVLSIDIDSDDYWVWSKINRVQPKVVVIEYNAAVPLNRRLTQRPGQVWDMSDAYGASLSAMVSLGKEKGMTLVHTDLAGVNAFFVRDEYVPLFPEAQAPEIHSVNFEIMAVSHPASPDWDSIFIDLDVHK